MNFVEPIRSKKQIEQMKELLRQQSLRDYFLFFIGINTGLRISDILALKVADIKNKSHVILIEKKTGKRKKFRLNEDVQETVAEYVQGKELTEYLFPSTNGDRPITRVRAYQILNKAARKLGISEIGCHSTRKTFGYFFYQKTRDIATLQMIFNHSHPQITLRYIGINQDLMDQALDGFTL